MSNDGRIGRRAIAAYAALAIPLSFAGLPLYIYAPDFYATEYGLSLSLLGGVLLVIRAFDAVQDPLIGFLSDHYDHYRSHMMLVAMLLLGGGFLLLFIPHEAYALLWFILGVVAATTAYSLLAINLNMLGAVWREDAHDKTRITSTREAFGLLGLLLAVSLPTALGADDNRMQAYLGMAAILCGLLVITGGLFFRWATRHRAILQARRTAPLRTAIWRLALRDYRFFVPYGLSTLASAMPAVLVMFFIRDRLGAETYTGLFLLLYFLSGAASMPLWSRLSKHMGKAQTWIASMVLAVASFIWAFWLGEGDLIAYGIICVTSGMALGAELALPPSILGDLMESGSSQSQAAAQFAILAFLAKGALALATGITLPAIEWFGFTPAAENSEQALLALSAAYALIPSILKLASGLLLWRWFIIPTQKGVAYAPHSS